MQPTMNTDQIWLLSYWAECELRGESPVSVPVQDLASSWENQQLIDQIKGGEPAFKTQQDYYRDMLIRRIREHIACWETEAAQPPAQP